MLCMSPTETVRLHMPASQKCRVMWRVMVVCSTHRLNQTAAFIEPKCWGTGDNAFATEDCQALYDRSIHRIRHHVVVLLWRGLCGALLTPLGTSVNTLCQSLTKCRPWYTLVLPWHSLCGAFLAKHPLGTSSRTPRSTHPSLQYGVHILALLCCRVQTLPRSPRMLSYSLLPMFTFLQRLDQS